MRDNYLCIKESKACRLLGSWSFLSSSLTTCISFHFAFFSPSLSLFFFFNSAHAVSHYSLHVDWVIRSDCETSQQRDAWQCQLERTEQWTLSTCITSNEFLVYKELCKKSFTSFCKQMSFSSCHDSKWQTCFALLLEDFFFIFFWSNDIK